MDYEIPSTSMQLVDKDPKINAKSGKLLNTVAPG